MNRPAAAITLAVRAHAYQTDLRGDPYILHPLRVMEAAPAHCRVVAVLHDVLEDTALTIEDVDDVVGLTPAEHEALQLLTRLPVVSYESYIDRIARSSSSIARAVKLADLYDNVSRIPADGRAWRERRRRYSAAIRALTP